MYVRDMKANNTLNAVSAQLDRIAMLLRDSAKAAEERWRSLKTFGSLENPYVVAVVPIKPVPPGPSPPEPLPEGWESLG
jgi:hypothetical protein